MQPKNELVDVISLNDIYELVARHKMLFVCAWGGCVLLAVAYLKITKPVYESAAVIEIGRVAVVGSGNTAGYIEAPEDIARRLIEKYRVGKATTLPMLSEVYLDNKGLAKMLIVKGQDYSANGASNMVRSVGQQIESKHAELFDGEMAVRLRHYRSLQVQNTVLGQYLNDSAASRDKKDCASMQYMELAILHARLLEQKIVIERKLMDMELANASSALYKTHIVSGPTLASTPKTPNSRLMLAFAAVMGLVVGVVALVFVEISNKYRKRASSMSGS